MCDLVTIRLKCGHTIGDTHQTTALFASTGVPNEADFSLESDQISKQMKLKALDPTSGQRYEGLADKNSDYFIGIRNGNDLEVFPLSMYRMNPIINLSETNWTQFAVPLTFKEQMEEIKGKFGSRRNQRSLASKRKYAIEFGEEDVQQIDSKTQMMAETVISESSNQLTINDSLDILPKQNRDAICVEEVYDINEIITENERNILSQNEDQLFQQINDPFIKQLISDPNNSQKKIIAIYIHLIISLLNVKPKDLRRANSLPSLPSEVKDFLFERYVATQVLGAKAEYILSPKQKDRLLIHGIILCLILYNFRGIEAEALQKAFKIQLRQMRKLIEIIGAYVETVKNVSGVNTKVVVLKIPLNTFIEKKKSFKRR